jgi:hypothetical protein
MSQDRSDYDRIAIVEVCRDCRHYWERKGACTLEETKTLTLRIRSVPGSVAFEYEREVHEATCDKRVLIDTYGAREFRELSLAWFYTRKR